MMARKVDREAVSEVIGFMIIFGLVVTSISLIYYVAIPGLEDAQDREQVENIQRSFSILHDNMEDVTVRSAPARGTQLMLDQSTLEVTSSGDGSASVEVDGEQLNASPTTYRSVTHSGGGDAEVVYENGAVLSNDLDGGSGMVYNPPWRVTEDEVVLPMVRTGGGTQTVSGTTTVMLRADRQGNPSVEIEDDVGEVNVTVTSPRSEGWLMYMELLDAPEDVGRIDDETVYMTVEDVERVIYLEYEVDLEIIR